MISDNVFGYLTIIGANIFYGSFGVPIKRPEVLRAQIDPVVYQFYKTFAVFCLSWLVLTYKSFSFTFWGFLGAAFWVPTGVCIVIAIRFSGLGIVLGLTGGVAAWVSFFWGAVIFNENVKSWVLSMVALLLLTIGMVGMAFVAFFSNKKQYITNSGSDDEKPLLANDYQNGVKENNLKVNDITQPDPLYITLWGYKLKKFYLGVAIATAMGFLNGTSMIPLKFAPTKDITYIISFACGAMLINTTAYIIYALFNLLVLHKPAPTLIFKVSLWPLLSGLLWTGGFFCGTYATLILGNTIGYPLVQCQILVSGMWGIFYYKEVQGIPFIILFFVFALILLGGVALLALYG